MGLGCSLISSDLSGSKVSALPDEILLQVRAFSGLKVALQSRLVCRRWSAIDAVKWQQAASDIKCYKEQTPSVHPDHVAGLMKMAQGWVTALGLSTSFMAVSVALPTSVFLPLWILLEISEETKITLARTFLESYKVYEHGKQLWDTPHPKKKVEEFIEEADLDFRLLRNLDLKRLSVMELRRVELSLQELLLDEPRAAQRLAFHLLQVRSCIARSTLSAALPPIPPYPPFSKHDQFVRYRNGRNSLPDYRTMA